MLDLTERISKQTLGSTRGYFKIIILICMYLMGQSFPLQGFARKVFNYCQLGLDQLHLNGWTILSSFENFCRIISLKPTVNNFRSCYQFIAGTDDDNDMWWFFTFANINNGAIKNTLVGKPMHVKKLRGRWLVVRFIGTLNPRKGLKPI